MTMNPNRRPNRANPLEWYRYLLRTASPVQLERAHAEAFRRMSPAERQAAVGVLASAGEVPINNSPMALAKSAMRLEARQPGSLEQIFGRVPGTGRPLLGPIVSGVVAISMYGMALEDSSGDFGGPGGGGLDFGGLGG